MSTTQSPRFRESACRRCVGVQGRMDLVDGVVKIGSTPTVCDYLLVPHLLAFQKRHPGIGLELRLQPDGALEKSLRDDELDCAFIIEFKDRDFFDAKPCFGFDETLVGSKDYIQSLEKIMGRHLKHYEDLANAQFVDFAQDAPNVRHWLKKNSSNYRKILEARRPAVVVEDYESVKRFVEAGLGLAMIPKYMTEEALKTSQLVEAFPGSVPTRVGVDFTMRKKKNTDPALKRFLEFIHKAL